jgi:hypothetical protein
LRTHFAVAVALLLLLARDVQSQNAFVFRESFENFDFSSFRTKIPNKNTQVRNGLLWTRAKVGEKYPPMVYLDVDGKDLVTQVL